MKKRTRWVQYSAVAVALIIGIILSVIISQTLQSTENQRVQSEVYRYAPPYSSAIQQGIDLNTGVVDSIGWFFTGSPYQDRNDFQAFTQTIMATHRDIQALEWIPLVRNSERVAYEQKAQADGFPGFNLTERTGNGSLQVVGSRDVYFPVYYVEPLAGNEAALGYDLASNAIHREALEKARDTGATVATAPVTLVQEKGRQKGFLIFKAVYRKGAILDSIDERRANLLGFALGVFRAGDMIESTIQYLPQGDFDINIEDSGAPKSEGLLFQTAPDPQSEPVNDMAVTATISVGGRQWVTRIVPTARLVEKNVNAQPQIILAGMLILTAFAALYTYYRLRSAIKIETLAASLSDANLALQQDITERKRAEEALRESEERYRNILDQIYDIYYEMDLAGNLTFVNEATYRKLGYSQEELIGKSYRLTVPEGDIKRLFAASKDVFKSGEPNRCYSHGILRKDGSTLFAESFIGLRRSKQGEVIGFRTVSRDITERKHAEETLKSSEERFAAAFNINPDPTAITVPETGQFIDVNPAYEKWSGFSREELIGSTADDMKLLVNPADREAFLDRLRNHEAVEDMEITFRAKSGELRDTWFTARTALIGGEEYLLTRAHDVTERNRMLADLRESEEKYRMVVENTREGIIILQGAYAKFVNQYILAMLEYSREFILSHPFMDYIHPDDRLAVIKRYQQRLAGEAIDIDLTIRLISSNGSYTWVEIRAVIIEWEGKAATLNFLTNVTDRKRLEEEQQRVDKLESVGLLAGGIAHDFNNILTAILGNISLARTEAAPGSELLNSLEQAEKASLRAKDLTQQLLTFSKGGAPVTKLASLTELLKDTVIFALRGSRVKCRFSVPADLWHAEIDTGQVSQVIHNLVINAQQAMPAGGSIEINTENIVLSGTQSIGKGLPLKEGDYVRIAVTDHGTGIPAEQLEQIFDPFFTTKQKGNGMGLATSFSIARQHGGHISVESELGSGSTFYFYLPASVETSTPKEDKKEAIKPVGKARILVMDDEKGVREIAGRMLKHIGYQDIEFATGGAEAIKLYKAAMKSGSPFTVAILDLTIAGGMGGEVAIQKLLKIDPGIKAIVSSGYIDDSVIAKYREYGFSGMVAKPYTLEELGKALQDVIG